MNAERELLRRIVASWKAGGTDTIADTVALQEASELLAHEIGTDQRGAASREVAPMNSGTRPDSSLTDSASAPHPQSSHAVGHSERDLLRIIVSGPHCIDDDTAAFYRDPGKPGNALHQLVHRVSGFLSQGKRSDAERLDWLEKYVVEVRVPLLYGSRRLFFCVPQAQEGLEDAPSDLRARIDARMSESAQRNPQAKA